AEWRAVWPATGRHTLLGVAASSYAHYIGDDVCRGVEALADVQGFTGRDSSLGHQVAERAPWAILVTDEWRRSARFDAKQIEQVLGSGWRMRTVPAGELYLSEDVAPR
ncbi:MAG TPA: hypothetical protein VHE13_06420, partial [Opitutus sp.]|nr:hypothetical protein [Opitutus sp.]